MKQFVLTLLMVCAASTLSARKITPEEARAKACAFWNKAVPATDGRQLKAVSAATSAYYVFNDAEAGFVIIAGDDAIPAVLGYSPTGTFREDSIPDGLKDMLEIYRQQIAAIPADAPAADTDDDFTGEKLLETNDWGQGAPFSNYCPNNYPTGCVATAMGIVLAYHGHPATGTGSHSYTWNGQTLSADFSQSTYDWDNMLPSYTGSYTDAQGAAVATLMRDLGIAVEMAYSEDGSGASMTRAWTALVNNFGYSDRIKTYSLMALGDDMWKDKLRQEIDCGRPVIYSGSNASDIGHAFVVDGYKDNLFSVNWGWNGSYNGFFQLGEIQADAGSEHYNEYNGGQYALFYVQPATNEDNAVSPLSLMPINDYAGFSANTTDVKAGSNFTALACRIGNGGTPSFSGYAYVALVAEDGTVRELLDSTRIELNYGYVYNTASYFICKPTVDALLGDSIMLLSRATDSTEYQLIHSYYDEPAVIPALGYEPRTANMTFDLGEGITCTEEERGVTIRYQGKILIGSPFYFHVNVPAGTTHTVVRGNGEELSLYSSSDTTLYVIRCVHTEDYTLRVRAYTEDEMLDGLVVAVSSPGSLESDMAKYELDVVRSLVVTGEVDQRDFEYLNNSGIGDIDMMDTRVVAYGSYAANMIPAYAFELNTSLTRFVMPWGITRIGNNAFRRTGLTKVTIPAGVTTYGLNVFNYCRSLVDVTVLNPNPAFINWCVLIGTLRQTDEGTLHVPAGCADAYRAADEWGLFTNIVEDAEDIYVGIHDISTSGEKPGVSVSGGVIRVKGAQSAAVYSMDGKCVGTGTETAVSPGLYIVRTGDKAVKVMVR